MSLVRLAVRPAPRLALLRLVVPLIVAACSSTDDGGSSAGFRSTGREGLTPAVDRVTSAGRFGGEAWRFDLSERTSEATHPACATVDGDLLLIQDQRHAVHAIDRKTGVHRWIIQLPGRVTQDVGGAGGTLSFVCTDELVTVSRAGGARVMPSASAHLSFFPSGRAVAIGTTAYIGRLAPSSVQAFNLRAGYEGWSYGTSGTVMDLVSYGEGPLAQIVGITDDGLLFAFPPRGANESKWAPDLNWYRRLGGGRPATPLTLAGDSLVFGADTGFLYHFDVRTGNALWKAPVDGDLRSHAAVVAGGAVYQRAGEVLHAFNQETGAPMWTCNGGQRLVTRIADRCYVDMGGGDISVLTADRGAEIGRFSLAGFAHVPSVQGGGVLIAGDASGSFFALE